MQKSVILVSDVQEGKVGASSADMRDSVSVRFVESVREYGEERTL